MTSRRSWLSAKDPVELSLSVVHNDRARRQGRSGIPLFPVGSLHAHPRRVSVSPIAFTITRCVVASG